MRKRKEITLDAPEAPMSREEQIRILESKLADPETSPKDAATLSRQIGLLKGTLPLPNAYRYKRPPENPELAQAEELRRHENEANELPAWWSERQCKLHLFWALCDTVSEFDFDGIITTNPNPKNAMFVAINQLWGSLSDDVRSKLQQLAVEHHQRSPLSGTDAVQFLDRALQAFLPVTNATATE